MSTNNICFYGENYPRVIKKYSALKSPLGTLTYVAVRTDKENGKMRTRSW